MKVGELRHRITLENPGVATPDGDGGYTTTAVALSPPEVSAAIQPATARDLERLVASTVQATATHIVTIRYHAGVTTDTQIVFGTRRFYVRGVQNVDERNLELRLACEEIV